MRRLLSRLASGCLLVLVSAVSAAAQSSIAGVVTDGTGAVLPGVVVEARSPVLIEQVKAGVTDGQGQYRIVDLRPGTYAVTFSLAGFSNVLRDGITLESNFVAKIDAVLKIGSIEETITVTGAAPVVDVQSSQRREVLTSEVMDALPTGRTFSTLAKALPAVAGQAADVGGSTSSEFRGGVSAYGGPGEQILIDGMSMSPGQGDGSQTVLFLNHGTVQEYVYQINGASAEFQTGGVQISMIPKTGGNRFAGTGVAIYSDKSLQTLNASAEQLAVGLPVSPGIDNIYDLNISLGGPMMKDRVWFFASYRRWAANPRMPMLHDGKLGPAGTQLIDKNLNTSTGVRFTTQVTPRNKVTVYYDSVPRIEYYNNVAPERRPEATGVAKPKLSYVAQVKWTSPISNTLLAEAGWSGNFRGYRGTFQPETRDASEYPPYGDIAKFEVLTNTFYNNITNEWYNPFWKHQSMASLSYVTGAHALKGGVQYGKGWSFSKGTSNGDILQRYRGGVPFSVDALATPLYWRSEIDMDMGVFLQDTWTIKRLTMNPGVRLDKFIGSVPAQSMPAGRFLPARSFAPIENLPNWTDVSLRFGAAYDLFGNGRTALKGSAGRYVASESVSFQTRYNPSTSAGAGITGDPRDWTDLNGDDIAQNNEIGPSRNAAFGTRQTSRADPDLKRSYDLLYNLTFEQELRENLGVLVSYNHRDVKNLLFTDNLAYSASDYEKLEVADPRGNGQMLPVYQIIPGRVRPTDNLDTNSDSNSRWYRGVDLVVHGRLKNGASFSGGTSTGRVLQRTCEVENPNALRFCDTSQFDVPFQTSLKVSGSYPLPWLGTRISAVLQSVPGQVPGTTGGGTGEQVVNYTVTRTQLPTLSTASSVVVRLNEPGTVFIERINSLDLNFSGKVKAGRLSLKPQIEVFNVLNMNPVLQVTTQFPIQGRPQQILQGRLVRLGMQVEF